MNQCIHLNHMHVVRFSFRNTLYGKNVLIMIIIYLKNSWFLIG
jgi:hypothetical protein